MRGSVFDRRKLNLVMRSL